MTINEESLSEIRSLVFELRKARVREEEQMRRELLRSAVEAALQNAISFNAIQLFGSATPTYGGIFANGSATHGNVPQYRVDLRIERIG